MFPQGALLCLERLEASELAIDLTPLRLDVGSVAPAFGQRSVQDLADPTMKSISGGGHEVGQSAMEIIHDLLELRQRRSPRFFDD